MRNLLGWLFVIFSLISQANAYDIKYRCMGENCFVYGWTSEEGYVAFEGSTCHRHDCRQYGWSTHFMFDGELLSFVECHNHSCFGEGYTYREMYPIINPRAYEVRCLARTDTKVTDCLTAGWEQVWSSGEKRRMLCINSDCAKSGWETFDISSGKKVWTSKCIDGNCFKNGWNEVSSR